MPALVMSRDDSDEHTRRGRVPRRVPVGLPRLLDGYRPGVTMDLRAHVAHYGSPPWRGMTRRGPGPLVHTIEHAGLRGRGGAAFPTARKVRAVSDHGGWPVVVANGAEGEPASQKDKLLLCALPHLVLDGAALLAEAVGASEVIVAVERPARAARVAVDTAIRARAAAELDPVPFRVVGVPGRYVAGEATALVNFVNTGVAKPTFVPPRVSERGVGGRPTLVQNVETLAHVALIARYGADWFRQLGTRDEPGSALVTVGGSVAHPAYSRWRSARRSARRSWRPADRRASCPPCSSAATTARGCTPPPRGTCRSRTLRCTRSVARSAAGWCTRSRPRAVASPRPRRSPATSPRRAPGSAVPASTGWPRWPTPWTASRGVPDRQTLGRLEELCDLVVGRGACHYPDGVVGFVRSARTVFAAEITRHRRDGGCRAAPPPSLRLPDATRERGWQ